MTSDKNLIALIRQSIEEFQEPERIRLGLRPEHIKPLVGVMGLALVVSVIFFLMSRPHQEVVAAPAVPTPSAVEIVVDVAGKVLAPGVYRLPEGSRAIDAITAAGGVVAGVGTENINLAHILSDGEQILVGNIAAASSLVNLNTASAAELDTLPGVGPVTAQRIVSWRLTHGRFRSIEEIKEVPGVGAATFANLKALIRV